MTHQTNEALIKAFKNHLDYYKDLKDKWEFLKTPEDRAFHAGKTQGMLLGLEVIERISIPQPEQLEVELTVGNLSDDWMKDVEAKIRFLQYFDTKQEALDFCKRYNLKIVNEEKE
jgi:hypothetical protein